MRVRDPLGLLFLIDEYVGVVFQDRLDSLHESHARHAWVGKRHSFRFTHDRPIRISLTLFCSPASAMPFSCPFMFGATCPKSVGPKTMARFCTDIAFSDSCWTTLDKKLSTRMHCGDSMRTCVDAP